MSLTLDEIAAVEEPAPGSPKQKRQGRRSPYAPNRREFVKAALGLGAAVGVSTLGYLPTARAASAKQTTHGAWQIWSGCTGLGSWVLDDNCNGCNQRILCCCNSTGYHMHDGVTYRHRPNDCKDGVYDGWTWLYSACCANGRRQQNWRCTDGYIKQSGVWKLSICRWRLSSQAC